MKVANGLLTLLLSILGDLEKLQRRVFDLVSNAYTSIRADDLASLMGVSTEAAVSGKFIISLIIILQLLQQKEIVHYSLKTRVILF